ncbi:MAG: S8 family peptidase [Chitinophagaceae bacterium]
MKKFVIFPCVVLLLFIESHAQLNRYIVFLKHKGATTFTLSNPAAYISQRAVDRRTRYSISIDSADLPVPASYISQIQSIPNVSLLNVSKWLNAITIRTTDANAITSINTLPFVQSSSAIALRESDISHKPMLEEQMNLVETSAAKGEGTQADFFNYGTNSFNEIHLHKGEFLHNIGLRGQGMQIAILDGGFFNYNTLDAMDSIVINNQVLSTWDFVNRETSVAEDDAHGMWCLSTIAANIPGAFMGKAPKASFHLYITEEAGLEYPIETFNWVCGAEKADSIGSDIISSSLGYNTFNNAAFDFTYNDMNGNTALCTKGADIAARKGIIVFNAVGNYGTGPWKYLAAPADGDSVVAVGAVSASGIIWPASSYGPSFDGRIKPDIASVGSAALIQNTNNTVGTGNGTSFACPNMAGLGTCLWQGFPEFNNMRIVRALKEAGSIVSTPNDRIGYGIPDMKAAFTSLLIQYATSSATINSCNFTLNWNSKDVSAMKYEIERKAPGDAGYSKIADVDAQAGTSLANHSYQFDNLLTNTTAGTVSYRIRQIIDTAAASFSAAYIDTANISLASACTTTATNDLDPDANKVIVSPNPTSGSTALTIYTRNAIPVMKIVLYDMKGRLMMQFQKSKGPGKTIIDLPVSQFAKGKYIIQVFDAQKWLGTAELLKL